MPLPRVGQEPVRVRGTEGDTEPLGGAKLTTLGTKELGTVEGYTPKTPAELRATRAAARSGLKASSATVSNEDDVAQLVATLGTAALAKGPIDQRALTQLEKALRDHGATKGLDDCKVNELRWWADQHQAQFTASGKSELRRLLAQPHLAEPQQGVVQTGDAHTQPTPLADWDKRWPGTTYQPAKAPVFDGPPKPEDINQGLIGDCYFLSSLGAVAKQDPAMLQRLIRDNHDGTYTVTFHTQPDAYHGTSTVEVQVDDRLPTTPDGQLAGARPQLASKGPVWPALLEKAYAKFKGGYARVVNDYPGPALTALTGRRAHSFAVHQDSDPAQVFSKLKSALQQHDALATWTACADASGANNPTVSYEGTNLVPSHVYTVLGVVEKDGERRVQLRNPWGKFEPGADGVNDGVFTLPLADYVKYFAGVTSVHLPRAPGP